MVDVLISEELYVNLISCEISLIYRSSIVLLRLLVLKVETTGAETQPATENFWGFIGNFDNARVRYIFNCFKIDKSQPDVT